MADYPLHASVLERLDPEYVGFHQKYLSGIPPSPGQWDPAIRDQESPISLADLPAVEVESIIDVKITNKLLVTVYCPKNIQLGETLPALLWFHGGMFKFVGPAQRKGENTDTILCI